MTGDVHEVLALRCATYAGRMRRDSLRPAHLFS
jgi:hypothetical protein